MVKGLLKFPGVLDGLHTGISSYVYCNDLIPVKNNSNDEFLARVGQIRITNANHNHEFKF